MTTIVTRAGKGSPLTNNEMDANLTNLNNDKVETSVVSANALIATGGVSVLDFGADPTNTSDSSAAFQLAVDSGAAIVYVPTGVYQINSTVNITESVRIVGCNIDFTMTGIAKCRLRSTSTTNDLFTINAHNVIIEGIDFTGAAGRVVNANQGCGVAVGTVSRTVTDGAMTASDTELTSATAVFTADDVGSYVSVAGAYNGTSTAYIVTFNSATSVELNAAADNTVSSASTTIAPVITGFVMRDCSAASQSRAVDFQNASNFTLDNCHLQGYYAVSIDSVAPDKGDSLIANCHLASIQFNIYWTASGGLRITNTKFLDCATHIAAYWIKGTSGGPVVSNCSFENHTGYAISFSGNSGTTTVIGSHFANNWISGGTRAIHMDDTIEVTDLSLVGNYLGSGSTTDVIYIGTNVDRFTIANNSVRGDGTCNGISIASGATNGRINDNLITNCSTNIANSSTSSVLVSDGKFYATRGSNQAIGTGAFTTIIYDTEVVDTCNWYDNTTGFYTPKVAGYYELSADVTYASITAGGAPQIRFRTGAATNIKTITTTAGATSAITATITATALFNGTTDSVAVQAYHANGANVDITVNSSFTATRIR